MKYTLDTIIRFAVGVGRCMEEEEFTLRELGFNEEYLRYGEVMVEKQLQEMYRDWEQNYLDGGWTIKED